jgi:hypothetical protein
MPRLGKMADESQTMDKNVKPYLSLVTFTAAALLICAAQLRAQDRLTKAADNRVYGPSDRYEAVYGMSISRTSLSGERGSSSAPVS